MIAYIKQHPGEVNYTSPAPRGTAHLAGEMLKQRTIEMTHINYIFGRILLHDHVRQL